MPRAGHVYVMTVDDVRVKVGFSKSPQHRALELGLTVVHSAEWNDHAELIERAAHKLLKLAGKRHSNEIFEATVGEAVEAIDAAISHWQDGTLPSISSPSLRTKKPVSYALDPELLGRLDAWLKRQEFPPTKTTIIEAALSDWLDRRERK